MTAIRSSLAPYAHLSQEPQDSAAWGASTRAWREMGIVMIDAMLDDGTTAALGEGE